MNNTNKRTNSSKSGFSLIEIVIVIAMMTVLAGIMVPNFNNYRTKADDTKIKTEMLNVFLGAETIANSHDTEAQVVAALKLTGGKNAKLTQYTKIADFTGYTFKISGQGDLLYVRYVSKLGTYTFSGNAERFMEKGRLAD